MKGFLRTPIDEAVVVHLDCLGGVLSFVETDRTHSLRLTFCVEVEVNLPKRTDGLGE